MAEPTPTSPQGNTAPKRSHEEISASTTGQIADEPAQKRQNVGASSIDPTNVSAADQVVSTSTNILTEAPPAGFAAIRSLPAMDEEEMMAMLSAQESGLDAARSGPSLVPTTKQQQKERQKQRTKGKYEKSAERYKGKGSREWDDRNGEVRGEGNELEKAPRLPKYKCAILLGFSGSGYSGMQMYAWPPPSVPRKESLIFFDSQNASATSPDAPPTATRTIEGILFKALVDVGVVAAINADDPKKVDLSRAARTDAGVSAAGNV